MEQPLPAERHRRIQELLRERRVVRVSSLSELLGVSEVTIRRDLEALERRGLLERTHGGAVLGRRMRAEPAYGEELPTNPEEKRRIGEAAAALVRPGDTIFLNGGTTTLEVFRALRAPGLKVVTNNVATAFELGEPDVELILLGGHVRPDPVERTVVGPFATDALRRVFATKAFIGVEGISTRSGLTTPVASEAEIAALMIEQTRGEVIVVADSSKVGVVADFTIASLERADRFVTDASIGKEQRQGLAELGVNVTAVGDQVTVPPDDS